MSHNLSFETKEKINAHKSIIASSKVVMMVSLETKILQHFPNAVEGQILTEEVTVHLATAHGFTRENTIVGTSTCPDEINRTVTRFSEHYGEEQFPLGGLTGFPFRGITGFGAYSHHAPDGGNLLIVFGPHVGISDAGELGKVSRKGQPHESTACGAALAFLNKYQTAVSKGGVYVPQPHPHDTEQHAIETMLIPHGERILNAQNPVRELVEVNYELIDGAIVARVTELTHHFSGKIALVGGIMINTSLGQPNYFEPRRLEIHQSGRVEKLPLYNATRH